MSVIACVNKESNSRKRKLKWFHINKTTLIESLSNFQIRDKLKQKLGAFCFLATSEG